MAKKLGSVVLPNEDDFNPKMLLGNSASLLTAMITVFAWPTFAKNLFTFLKHHTHEKETYPPG